ncbi:MAG: CBS domain-containing protein [Candidatus Hydrothermarchaeota archaeon]
MRVSDLMNDKPMAIKKDDLVTKARSILRESPYEILPVVDEERTLIGIVTLSDVLGITSTRSNIRVEGIMKDVTYTFSPDTEIQEAVKKFIKHGDIEAPVTSDGILVGIISCRDILRGVVESRKKPKIKYVSEVMKDLTFTCMPEDPVSKVWMKMCSEGHKTCPVIKKKKFIGYLSQKEILSAGFARIERESSRIKSSTKVEKLMRPKMITTTPDSKIENVTKKILKLGVPCIFVEKYKRIIGILECNDLLKAYF